MSEFGGFLFVYLLLFVVQRKGTVVRRASPNLCTPTWTNKETCVCIFFFGCKQEKNQSAEEDTRKTVSWAQFSVQLAAISGVVWIPGAASLEGFL